MIALSDFEGIAGFRWGALVDRQGHLSLRGSMPDHAEKRVGVIARVMRQGPFQLEGSDLVFEMGKVVVRRGSYGLLMLFLDDHANVSIVNALVLETEPASDSLESHGISGSRIADSRDSSLSTVHSVSLDSKPVPPEVIEELLDLYTTFLGPLARALAKKQCRSEGLDLENLTTRQWSKLLNTLASRITDEAKHEGFLDRAVLLKTRF